MKLKDTLNLLSDSDMLRIKRSGEDIYIGYLCKYKLQQEEIELTGEEEVDRLQVIPEIRHRQWKQRNLLPPISPGEEAQYKFSDMEIRLYYAIFLKG